MSERPKIYLEVVDGKVWCTTAATDEYGNPNPESNTENIKRYLADSSARFRASQDNDTDDLCIDDINRRAKALLENSELSKRDKYLLLAGWYTGFAEAYPIEDGTSKRYIKKAEKLVNKCTMSGNAETSVIPKIKRELLDYLHQRVSDGQTVVYMRDLLQDVAGLSDHSEEWLNGKAGAIAAQFSRILLQSGWEKRKPIGRGKDRRQPYEYIYEGLF